jgi:hypothetical protein
MANDPKKGPGATDPALDALKTACKGLMMPSESDAPFSAFTWPASGDLTHEGLLQLAGEAPGSSVEEDTLDNLWRTIPSGDRARFQKLQQAIHQQLSNVTVYKVGDEAERQVYIVGKTQGGQWVGLKTSVVET